MKRLPLIVSFIAVVALSVSLAYWALQLFKAPQRPISAAPPSVQPEASLDGAGRLFGGASVAVAVSNYQLKGVVASGSGSNRGSVAILAYDNKPARALPVGAEVVPGVTVKEVQKRYVLLAEGGVVKRVDLASSPTAEGSAGTYQAPRPPIPMPSVPSVPAAPAQATPPQLAPPMSPQQQQAQQQFQQAQQQAQQQVQQNQPQNQQNAPALPLSRSGRATQPEPTGPPPQE